MRRILPIVLKGIVAASLIAAALDLKVPSGHQPRMRSYLLDISASMHVAGAPGSLKLEDGWRIITADATRFDRVCVIAFGKVPETLYTGPPEGLPISPPVFKAPAGTDTASALDSALAHNPDDVVLLSDGNENRGNLDKAILVYKSRDIPVHTITLGPRAPADVRITSIRAPSRVAPGKEFALEVEVLSTTDTEITIMLGGLSTIRADLVRHQPRTVRFPGLRISERTPLSVVISPTDACPENNRVEWIVEPETNLRRILLLRKTPSGLSDLLREDGSLHLVEKNHFEDPLAFDVVVLDSFPADQLTRTQQLRIRDFVEQSGGGLLAMGGPDSFAPGGYAGTSIETVLPTWAFPDEKLGLVFVLDRSGSMAAEAPGMDRRKLDTAVSAIGTVLDSLRPADRAAVITFAGDRKILGPLTTDHASLREKLAREQPNGPTVLLPAIREAIRLLGETTTPRKAIVILTDGRTEEPEEEFHSLGKEIAGKGVRLLSIHTGSSPGENLRALGSSQPIAEWAELAAQVQSWVEESRELVITPTKPSRKLGFPAKINRVTLKPAANLIAACGDHPLLAIRQSGRGKAAAATFALREGWTGSLKNPGGAILELIDRLSPAPVSPYQLSASVNRDQITITARGPDTGPVELPIQYEHHPGKIREKLLLPQTSPTTWEKTVPLPDAGIAWYRPLGYRGGRVAVSIPYPGEYARLGQNRNRLLQTAQRTSGRFIREEKDLEAGPEAKRAWKSGKPFFLAGALILFLLDIAISAFWRPTRQLETKKQSPPDSENI